MDVKALEKRLVSYQRSGFKDLVALDLSPSEVEQVRRNITTGVWLESQKSALHLGDPAVIAVFGGIAIRSDPAEITLRRRNEALEIIAASLK